MSSTFWECDDYWMETKHQTRMHVSDGQAVKPARKHNHSPNGSHKQVIDVLHVLLHQHFYNLAKTK